MVDAVIRGEEGTRDASRTFMKLVVASVVLGFLLVIAGAACGRRTEAVGQTQTTGATIVPNETDRTAAPSPPPAPAEPSPVSVAEPPSAPAAPIATYAVPGIVDDRGASAGRESGTLSVIHAGDVAASLETPPPASVPSASPPQVLVAPPAPSAPLLPSAASPIPWTGTESR